MQVSLFNSKNPNGKRIPVNISLNILDNTNTNDGEPIYILSFYTAALDKDTKKRVDPVFIENVNKPNVLQEINNGLTVLGNKIDWGILEEDTHPPQITQLNPKSNDTDVDINTVVTISLKDPFPASFIDPSTIKLKANGHDITNQIRIKEKNNEMILTWIPTKII